MPRPSAPPFELVLFARGAADVRSALAAGIGTFIVDWEWRGKESRQSGFDTEINRGTPEQLAAVTSVPGARTVCRLNAWGPWTREEVDLAVRLGASTVMLPMVRRLDEAERLLDLVAGRAGAGILVETHEACTIAADLARLPLAMVYVGLNDLAIDRGCTTIFESVCDGTVDAVRAAFHDIPFGFGGITVVGRGDPIPFRLLHAEMARLGCSFSFLRRSFRRDVAGRDTTTEVKRISEQWRALNLRSAAEVEQDRTAFCEAVAASAAAAVT